MALIDSMVSSSHCLVSINIIKYYNKVMMSGKLWHNILEYAHLEVMKNVLKSKKLLCTYESFVKLYTAFQIGKSHR